MSTQVSVGPDGGSTVDVVSSSHVETVNVGQHQQSQGPIQQNVNQPAYVTPESLSAIVQQHHAQAHYDHQLQQIAHHLHQYQQQHLHHSQLVYHQQQHGVQQSGEGVLGGNVTESFTSALGQAADVQQLEQQTSLLTSSMMGSDLSTHHLLPPPALPLQLEGLDNIAAISSYFDIFI